MASQWSASKAEFERARRTIGGGLASSVRGSSRPHQIYFESGRGARLVDIEGNGYVDYALADGVRAASADAGHTLAVHHLGATVLAAPGLSAMTGPDDYFAADWQWWNELVAPPMLARGIYLLPSGRLFLSTEHGAEEVSETVAAFADVFAEVGSPAVRHATAV